MRRLCFRRVIHLAIEPRRIAGAAHEKSLQRRAFESEIEGGIAMIGRAVDLHLQIVEPGGAIAGDQCAEIDVRGVRGNGESRVRMRPIGGAFGAMSLHIPKATVPCRASARHQKAGILADFVGLDVAAEADGLAAAQAPAETIRGQCRSWPGVAVTGASASSAGGGAGSVRNPDRLWRRHRARFRARPLGVCMSKPVNSTRPLPLLLNSRIHSTMSSTSWVSQVQKYMPLISCAGSPLPLRTIIVELVGLRHVGFDGEDGEAHLRGQELQHAVLELEELARAVGGLAERDDARIADDFAERLHIVEAVPGDGRGEANRVGRGPTR